MSPTDPPPSPLTPEPAPPQGKVDLSLFTTDGYYAGRSFLIRLCWYFANALFLQNPFNPLSRLKVTVLRAFGAKVGKNVYLKPGIRVKNPWMLSIGDNTWIGEDVWIDNLAPVRIGNNVCLSQAVYLCTGNHDWSDPAMPYRLGEISIEDGVWICTRAVILPGVVINEHAIITAGAVLATDAQAYMIYAGNPAKPIKPRNVRTKA